MSTTTSIQVFELAQDWDRLPDEAYKRIHSDALWRDLWTDPKPYNDEVTSANDGWGLSDIFDKNGTVFSPKQVVLFGWFDLLTLTELPTNSLGWTIISKSFLDVVKQIGFTSYQLISLRVIDRAQFDNVYAENPRHYEGNSVLQDLRYDDDMFYGFKVLSRASLLTKDSDDTNRMGKKVIWRNDVTELPFFFYESRFPGALLVNQEARDALEKAGIRGIQFTPAFK
jgi:hypothetical protein